MGNKECPECEKKYNEYHTLSAQVDGHLLSYEDWLHSSYYEPCSGCKGRRPMTTVDEIREWYEEMAGNHARMTDHVEVLDENVKLKFQLTIAVEGLRGIKNKPMPYGATIVEAIAEGRGFQDSADKTLADIEAVK